MRQIESGDVRLGSRMRQLRQAYSRTQENVARGMHVNPDKLRRFEKGEQMPTHHELQKFGVVLELPNSEADELFQLAAHAVRGGSRQASQSAPGFKSGVWQPDDERRFLDALAAPTLMVGKLDLPSKLLPASLWDVTRQQYLFLDDPEEERGAEGRRIVLEWTNAMLPEDLLTQLVQEIQERLGQFNAGSISLSAEERQNLQEVYRRLTSEGSNPYPRPVALPEVVQSESGGRTLRILLGQGKFGISLVAEKALELPTALALRSQHILHSLALRVAYVFDREDEHWVEFHQREEHGNATWKGAWDVGAAGYVDPLNHRDPRDESRISPWQGCVDEISKELGIPTYELPHRDHYRFFGLAREKSTGHIILVGYCHGSFIPDPGRKAMALVRAYDRCRLTPEAVADFIRAKRKWVPAALLTLILTLEAFRFSKARIERAFSSLAGQLDFMP
jgi:transcriptional regulator with XRE-family HTH domain